MTTKYLNQSGTDLSFVYASYIGGQKAIASGYKTSTGLDLSDLFAKYTNFKRPDSGYLDLTGNDLSTLYQGRPITYTFSNMLTTTGNTNNLVNGIHAFNLTNVFVGGQFTTIGGTSANYVAKWNGSSWSALSGSGTPPGGTCYEVYAYNLENVFVCHGSGVSKWNSLTSTWSSFLTGGVVHTIYVYDLSNIYVGGSFTSVNPGSVSANNIARWNGSSWSALRGGTDGVVNVIRGYDLGNIYVGGVFPNATNSSSLLVNYIAKWNGTTWSALNNSGGVGTSGSAVNRNGLYILGPSNVYIGGGYNLFLWNGTTIAIVVATNTIYAIYAFEASNIIFGGNGTLRLWNGSTATNISPNVGGNVIAISVIDSSNIFIGGQFDNASVGKSISKMSIT